MTRSDDGVVLMFVVIFVLVFGLISAALLDGITVGTRNTATVRSFDTRSYQVDAGIDYGIQSLRTNTTLCPDSDHPSDIAVPAVLSAAVSTTLTIHCQTITGSANGGQGWAIVATSGVGSKNGGNKRVDGPIWAAGFNLQGGGTFTVNGDVTDKDTASNCNNDKTSITFVAPHTLTCTTGSAPTIDEKTFDLAGLNLTTKTAVANVFQPAKKVGGCSIFAPGNYTGGVTNAAFNFGSNNYFASGVYYLKNVSFDVSGNVIAGEPPGGESYANTPNPQVTACSNDTVAGEANHSNGYGALFVLDGASEINVSGSALLEAFSRSGGDESTEGRQGLSVRTLSTWSRPTDGTALSIGTGSNPELEIHGTIYAPGATVDIGATASPKAAVLGGVICATVYVSHASNVSNGTQISVLNGIGYRHILLTATSSGGGGGERDVVATAVIDVLNDVDRTYVIESRRNGGFSSTT